MEKIRNVAIFLFFTSLAYSQTIINAESLIDGVDSTVYAFKLSYSGTKGNSNTDQLDVSPTFILLRKKNEYRLLGGYSWLSESDNGILNSGFIHVRHNYKLFGQFKLLNFISSSLTRFYFSINGMFLVQAYAMV